MKRGKGAKKFRLLYKLLALMVLVSYSHDIKIHTLLAFYCVNKIFSVGIKKIESLITP